MPVASLLLLLYPVLVRVAVHSGNPWMGAGAIVFLGMLVFLPSAVSGAAWAWVVMLLISAAACATAIYGGTEIMLYLPPLLIPLALAWFFGRTLLPGSRALISRISEAMRREPLPPEVERYTRRVTIMWVTYFLVVALNAAILPWLVSQHTWWLFTHVLAWIAVPTLMLGEYLYHSRRYPNKTHRHLGDFLRDLIRVDYRKLFSE